MKIAIVTGASSGLGMAFVRRLDALGGLDEIWGVARRGERMEALAAELAHEISKYREQVLPAIIQIPGISGNTGAGVAGVKKSVEQAVGSDIIFSNN